MTLFDFFFNQTNKQIKDCFRKVGLEKHYDLSDNKEGFCRMFGLTPDSRVTTLYTSHAHGKGFIYVYLKVPNTVFPETPIEFELSYCICSCKGACTVSLMHVSTYDRFDYFKEVSDLYDDRPEYNNIKCSISLNELGDFADGLEVEDLKFAKTKTVKDVYDAIIDYALATKPYIVMFMQSTKDGSYEKFWNKYSPKDQFKRGKENIFKMFAPSQIKSWMLIERSGHKMSLEEFVLLNVATEKKALGDRTGEVYSSDDNTRVKACLDLIDAYKNNYVEDTSFNDWCELYEKAYHKMRKRYAEEREKISKELGINQKYVGVFCKQWPQNYVPEDAYDLDWRDENWKD